MGVPSTYESTQWVKTLVIGTHSHPVKRKNGAGHKRGRGLERWREQQ